MDIGVDKFLRDDYQIFFSEICSYCDPSTVQYLINEFSLNINIRNGQPLYNALSLKQLGTVKLLLELGANILDRHIMAALKTDPECVDTLIQYGSINEERFARVFIFYAFDEPRGKGEINVHIAKSLINKGIDFNQIIGQLPEKYSINEKNEIII